MSYEFQKVSLSIRRDPTSFVPLPSIEIAQWNNLKHYRGNSRTGAIELQDAEQRAF